MTFLEKAEKLFIGAKITSKNGYIFRHVFVTKKSMAYFLFRSLSVLLRQQRQNLM